MRQGFAIGCSGTRFDPVKDKSGPGAPLVTGKSHVPLICAIPWHKVIGDWRT